MSDVTKKIDKVAYEILDLRKRHLFVLYYATAGGYIRGEDVKDIYQEARQRGWDGKEYLGKLDVLLHTMGGDPNAAYRIAQVIRNISSDVVFLVPERAFSGGTLTCLCGNEIRLGAYAALSPIDITFEAPGAVEPRIELLNVDYYMGFTTRFRRQIEEMLKEIGTNSSTNIDSALATELVKDVRPLNVGKFFRERTLTGYYAERLLDDYMLANRSNKETLRNSVIGKILFEFPSHEYEMDFHICHTLGLPVKEMELEEFDKTMLLVSILDELTEAEVICRDLEAGYKLPFFRLYAREA